MSCLKFRPKRTKQSFVSATIIKSSQQAELGSSPLFLQSQESQTVFKKYGFIEASKKIDFWRTGEPHWL